jgi:serine/threonine protein kinase
MGEVWKGTDTRLDRSVATRRMTGKSIGIAKVVSEKGGDSTRAGVFVGNMRCSSPEQLCALAEEEQLDGRADVYCLGIVLYEMLAGMTPFNSTTPQGYAVQHLTSGALVRNASPHFRSRTSESPPTTISPAASRTKSEASSHRCRAWRSSHEEARSCASPTWQGKEI